MSATQLINVPAGAGPQAHRVDTQLAKCVVEALLGDRALVQTPILEASVHRPARGRVWVAAYTGPESGQVWRSTGLTDRAQALLVARQWEAEARAERSKLGRTPRKPLIRVRRSEPFSGSGPLTQREVALLLGMSERAVRQVEHRAIEKLRRHPFVRQIWQQFLAGELDEFQHVLTTLTSEEIEALFKLCRSTEERLVVEKVLWLIRTRL